MGNTCTYCEDLGDKVSKRIATNTNFRCPVYTHAVAGHRLVGFMKYTTSNKSTHLPISAASAHIQYDHTANSVLCVGCSKCISHFKRFSSTCHQNKPIIFYDQTYVLIGRQLKVTPSSADV